MTQDPKSFPPEELTTGDITAVGDKPGDWMKDPNFLANAGHVGWGFAIMLVAAFFTPLVKHYNLTWNPLWVPGVTQLVLAFGIGFKEYYLDHRLHRLDERRGDWMGDRRARPPSRDLALSPHGASPSAQVRPISRVDAVGSTRHVGESAAARWRVPP